MSLSSSESDEPIEVLALGSERIDSAALVVAPTASSAEGSYWENDTLRGALRGLVPLGLLVVVVGITLALSALTRQLFAGSGFFAQQEAAVITLIVGLVLTIVVYGVAIFFTLRRVATWQQTGAAAQARAALWALGVTAFIVVLPVLLAIVLPQHPAP